MSVLNNFLTFSAPTALLVYINLIQFISLAENFQTNLGLFETFFKKTQKLGKLFFMSNFLSHTLYHFMQMI